MAFNALYSSLGVLLFRLASVHVSESRSLRICRWLVTSWFANDCLVLSPRLVVSSMLAIALDATRDVPLS